MALLKYTGLSSYRQLLQEDLAKVGVEVQHALTFARHEIVKVSDQVAEGIKNLAGDEFEEVKDDVKAEEVRDAEKDPQPVSQTAGAYVPTVAPPAETTSEAAPAETSQTTETGPAPEQGTPEQPQNTPVQAEPVQQNPEQPTPSEQPASEVEGPGAGA